MRAGVHITENPDDDAFIVNHKGAAFNLARGLPVHHLLLNHIKGLAEFFFRIGKKVKGKVKFRTEILMALLAIARNAKDLKA